MLPSLSAPSLAATLALLSAVPEPAPATAPRVILDEGEGGSPIADLIQKHSLLSRLNYEMENAERPGFLLHIQLPRQDSPGHTQTVSRIYGNAYGSMGENMRLMFPDAIDSELVQYVYVCASENAFINLKRFGIPDGRNIDFATTLPDLRMVVTYMGIEGEENQVALFAALHEGAFKLLERARSSLDPLQDLWLFDGLATYFANGASRHLAPGLTPSPDKVSLETLEAILAEEATAKSLLLPAEALLGCNEARDLRRTYLRHASDVGAAFPDEGRSVAAFRAQSALLAHFLLHAEGARYRDGFRKYVGRALANEGGPTVLAESLDLDLAQLDEAFRAFSKRLIAGASSDALSDEMMRALGAEGANHPAVLPRPIDADEWLALAIGSARLGDLSGALLALEIGSEAASGDMAERIGRERVRIETLRSARDAYLQSILGTKTRLRMHLDGAQLSSVVVSVEDGVAQLGENKRGVSSIELRQILPADIAENIARNATDFGPAWAPSYGLLLGNDSRWDKDLDEEDPEARALAEDAGSSFKDLVEQGEAMARLKDLAGAPLPDSLESARELNAAITKLLEDFGELDIVRAKYESLRNLSLQAWSQIYQEEGLSQLLKGDIEVLGEGRVRITYDFQDDDQLEDFKRRDGYLASHKSFEGKSAEDSKVTIKKKALKGDGFLCFEHVLGFEAPMEVKYEIKYDKTKKKNKDAQSTFILGICDDGAESYVLAYNMYDLEVVDKKNRYDATAFAEGDREIKPKSTYKLELSHDGESLVTLKNKGKEVRTVDPGKRRAGSVFFWMNTQVPISIEELVIEGKVIETVLSRMENEWVAAQLEEMFGG